MSNTGNSTVSCGLPHFRLDWASDNQSSPYTTYLIGLWPLILGLHRPCSQHATVPSTLSSEGQLLVSPPRFSGPTPTGERDSCATWAQYYEGSVAMSVSAGGRSRICSYETFSAFRCPSVPYQAHCLLLTGESVSRPNAQDGYSGVVT